jgi:hypothetical protein
MTGFWQRVAVVVASAVAAAPALTLAQDDEPAYNTGGIGLEGGVDWTTAYFFRGILQEDRGIIVQPWAQVNVGLITEEQFTLDGYVGIWNSLHSRHTDAGAIRPPIDGHVETNRAWYEFDFFAGLDLGVGDFTIGLVYTLYTSPSHAFASLDELGLIVSYDDSALWGDRGFAVNPYVAVYQETRGGNASHLEVGITPEVELDLGRVPLTLGVPVIAGFSLRDYYEDTFGYVQIGIQGTVPLPMPERYGQWELTGGVSWLHLASNDLQAANRGDRNAFVGTVGVGFSY